MYLTSQAIIGIALFLFFILLFIISTKIRTILISHITRHECIGNICPTSVSLIIKDSLNRTVAFIGRLRSYFVLFYMKDDESQVQYFKGYLPSLSNSWTTMDLLPDIRVFNLAINGDGVYITDILVPFPSDINGSGSTTTPFDVTTGEPAGVVNFMSIRRALSTELSDRIVQSMSLAEIIKRTKLNIYFHDGVHVEKYLINMSRFLAILGLQINGDIKLINGPPDIKYKRRIKCSMLIDTSHCFFKVIKMTWGWWLIAEALSSLILTMIPSSVYSYIIVIIMILVVYLVILLLSIKTLRFF